MSTSVQEPSAGADGLPAAGWYPDPVEQRSRRHHRRFWDGSSWTARVADGEQADVDPMPPPLSSTRTALPGRAAWVALAGFVVGQLLSVGGWLLGQQLAGGQRDGGLILPLLLSVTGLWVGLLGACVVASRRWGTGRLRDDYAIRTRGSDVGRGLLIALVLRAGVAVVVVVLVLLAPRLAGSNTGVLQIAEGDLPALLALAVLMVVGAPLVEEVFFRGLLLRSLRCRLGAPAAVLVQAVAFGAAHAGIGYGWANVGIVLATALGGIGLGAAAEHYQRLGPSMWAHAWFNLVPATILLATQA